jgi:hypothetical protein
MSQAKITCLSYKIITSGIIGFSIGCFLTNLYIRNKYLLVPMDVFDHIAKTEKMQLLVRSQK